MLKIKYKILIMGLLLCITTPSCDDYLDQVPEGTPTIESVFNNKSGAFRFLASIYSVFPSLNDFSGHPAQITGDEAWVNDAAYASSIGFDKSGADVARGRQSVDGSRMNYWTSLYIGIRDCNVFLDQIDRPQDITEVERKQWIAEVKVLKAYYHFFLMRQYGPIPIVRDNLELSDGPETVRVERDPVDEVVDYIVELIDEALPDLLPSPGIDALAGRINQATAAAIKARALVTAASPLFNGNTDFSLSNSEGVELINSTFDPTKWDRAVEACSLAVALAEGVGHSLFKFEDAFVPQEELSDTTLLKMSIRGSFTDANTPEVIWAATGRTVGGQQGRSMARLFFGGFRDFFALRTVTSLHAPTLRVAEMFYSENGVPIEEDVSFDYNNRFDLESASNDHDYYVLSGKNVPKLHLNREARFYASLGFDGNRWYGQGELNDELATAVEAKSGQTAGIQSTTNDYSATGYFAKKLAHYRSAPPASGSGGTVSYTSYAWPIVRLADLYLLYAEALNESKSVPDNEVYEWIDKVRARAGLEGVVNSWNSFSSNPSKPSTKEGMREIIQQERMIELVFEGHRTWDLLRWKRASEFRNKPIRAWNVQASSESGYYNVQTIFQPIFTNKDYFWPIDLGTLLNNEKLVQNPGW